MTSEGLAYINTALSALNIPYQYMGWTTSPVPATYWVGEYSEVSTLNEDRQIESLFLLTGTTNSSNLDLEWAKDTIMEAFPIEGITDIMTSGSGIAISYDGAIPIPSIEEGVHRLQITLNVKEWRV